MPHCSQQGKPGLSPPESAAPWEPSDITFPSTEAQFWLESRLFFNFCVSPMEEVSKANQWDTHVRARAHVGAGQWQLASPPPLGSQLHREGSSKLLHNPRGCSPSERNLGARAGWGHVLVTFHMTGVSKLHEWTRLAPLDDHLGLSP